MAQDDAQWRRFQKLKRSPRNVGRRLRKIESSTLKHAHTFIVRRWANVRDVRRHIFGWLGLTGLLIAVVAWQSIGFATLYTAQAPTKGGAFSEGVVGRLDTLNPLFATSLPERSAAKLIFSSLLTYDYKNQLTGDLAESWRYEDDGKSIVVKLRPDTVWQDGQKLTSADVLFTTNLIKNTNVGSPLRASWQGVTVQTPDERTVKFVLPAVNAQFVDSLTVGIVPKHLLSSIDVTQLKVAPFNRSPIGSGAFEFRSLKKQANSDNHVVLSLGANARYYLGAPRLNSFYLHAFAKMNDLAQAYKTDEVNAAVNLDVNAIAGLPEADRATIKDSPINDGTYAFFRTDSPLLKDVTVRKALRQGINRPAIIAALDKRALPLEGPLVPGQLSPAARAALPKQPAYNQAEASKLLESAGWKKDSNGIRSKDGQQLVISLVTARSGDFSRVADRIARDWKDLGVKVETQYVTTDKLNSDVIDPRSYDVLVYELALGRDPDTFAYWSSTQTGSGGFNLSNYSSGVVDDALLTGRGRLEKDLREAKYSLFYKQWIEDAPAVALFQPTLHYAVGPNATAISDGRPVIDAVDRYAAIRYWSASKSTVFATP